MSVREGIPQAAGLDDAARIEACFTPYENEQHRVIDSLQKKLVAMQVNRNAWKKIAEAEAEARLAAPDKPAQQAEALTIARNALEKISTWRFGWDGDCGVTAAADEAIAAIDAAMAAQPADDGKIWDDQAEQITRDMDLDGDWPADDGSLE